MTADTKRGGHRGEGYRCGAAIGGALADPTTSAIVLTAYARTGGAGRTWTVTRTTPVRPVLRRQPRDSGRCADNRGGRFEPRVAAGVQRRCGDRMRSRQDDLGLEPQVLAVLSRGLVEGLDLRRCQGSVGRRSN